MRAMSSKQITPYTSEISTRLSANPNDLLDAFTARYCSCIGRVSTSDKILQVIAENANAEFSQLLKACWVTALTEPPEQGVAYPSFLYNTMMRLLVQRLRYSSPLNIPVLNQITELALDSEHFCQSLLSACETVCRKVYDKQTT